MSGLGQKESETGQPPSHANLRAKLLLGASWSLALTGWSYILLPRFTLSAYFGASGGVVRTQVSLAQTSASRSLVRRELPLGDYVMFLQGGPCARPHRTMSFADYGTRNGALVTLL